MKLNKSVANLKTHNHQSLSQYEGEQPSHNMEAQHRMSMMTGFNMQQEKYKIMVGTTEGDSVSISAFPPYDHHPLEPESISQASYPVKQFPTGDGRLDGSPK